MRIQSAPTTHVEENVIPLRFRIENLPILVGVLFIVMMFLLYFIFFFQGRWLASMPILAEVAAAPPAGIIFSAVITVIAFISFLLLMAVVNWGELSGVFKSKFVTFGQIFSVLCPAFLMVVANCRPDDTRMSVYFGTAPFSVLVTVFFLAIFVRTFRATSLVVKIVRTFIISLAAIFLLLTVVPFPDEWKQRCTKRAVCLLGFTLMILAFFVSFKRELGQLKVDIVVFADDL
jgi:hypothetical protein